MQTNITQRHDIEVNVLIQNDTNEVLSQEAEINGGITDLDAAENIAIELIGGEFVVTWENSNVGIAGFNIYKAKYLTGAKRKVNSSLIPSGQLTYTLPRSDRNNYIWVTVVKS